MYSNSEIFDGLIHNDQKIISCFYKSQYPLILSWIKRNSGCADDADDICQEAFLIIIRKLRAESLSLECSFSTFHFSICKNLWLQELRRRSRVQLNDLQICTFLEDSESNYELEERKRKIYLKHFFLLEEKCRQLLLLYCRKKSLEEIKNLLGFVNTQAVADKKKNCRKALIRKLLNSKEYKDLQSEI
jgi:RNA polymerase sigma factor (sigma-70 family)